MIRSPRFSGHDEQRALLGCAADLDPEKYPRRFQQQQARMAVAAAGVNQYEKRAAEGKERRRAIAKRAERYLHLSMREAAPLLGISYDAVRKLAGEFDLNFKKGVGGRPTKQYEQ